MAKCLITTLAESTGDTSLLKVDEFRFHQNSNSVETMDFWKANVLQNGIIEIEGDGYFTDSTGTTNLGKSYTVSGHNTIYISPGEYDIKVSNKSVYSRIVLPAGCEFNMESAWGLLHVSYIRINGNAYGDITPLHYNTTENHAIRIAGNNVSGRITSLPTGVVTYLFMNSSQVKGTTTELVESVFSSSTNVQLLISGMGLSGPLSAFATLANLTTLDISNTDVTGDTSDLASLTKLTAFTYTNTAITGTWPLV